MTNEQSQSASLPNHQATPDSSLFNKILTKLSRTLQFYRRPVLAEKIASLTVSQYFYFAAFLLFVVTVGDNYIEEERFLLVGIIAGLGLFREFWHLFQQVWQRMLGKAVLLVLYAGTANFVLALSAQKINAIVGVEPSPFVFTLGFTTLIMLPFWLISATVVFFSIAMVALNLWLLFSVLLRIVRIKIKVHWEDSSFVFLTMLFRLILIPSVIMMLTHFATPYANQIALFDAIDNKPGQTMNQAIAKEPPKTETDEAINQAKDTLESALLQKRLELEFEASSESSPETTIKPKTEQIRYIDTMVANFVFWFETYPNSACIKEDHQRSLMIDDFSMLVVEPDDSELGYSFEVSPCIPVYEKSKKSLSDARPPRPE